MNSAEELTSWRVAAIEGTLPTPTRADRWQPLRAGLVNLWEYDAAEVWYADGRMQLQGANESGKSTLMTLTTLLLLAGDISAHNIDTLGQDGKRFRYYVEPTDHPLDRRDTSPQKNRGWAWLEFGRGSEFFTLLLFAETRRADANLKVTWCTLHGQARVRSGLKLVTAGFAADPPQFKEVPGFAVHPSGAAYREVIAHTLYGAEEAWLNQLIRILRVIRTPQIGTKIDLRFLTESFRTALPPVAEDEINQLADGWEQLQRLRDERDEAERALAIVSDFSRRSWRPWADAVIRAAADPVIAATSTLTQITREEKAASDGVETLQREVDGLESRITERGVERQTAAARRDTLQETAAYQDAVSATANATQLAERAAEAERRAEQTDGRASRAQAEVAPAEESARKAGTTLDAAERDVLTAAGKLSAQADKAGLVGLTSQHLPGRDLARLRQGARLRIAAAKTAAELISVHAAALTSLETAAGKAAQAQADVARAGVEARRQEEAVTDAIAATAAHLSTWADALDERIRPATARIETWMTAVARLTDALQPSSVLDRAVRRDHLLPLQHQYRDQRFALRRGLADYETSQNQLRADLTMVEQEDDPSPREPEFWVRRARPAGVTPVGAPFWRLVETTADPADASSAARLEAALDAAGLLQAWVTPDGAYLGNRDGSDAVWTAPPDPGAAGPALRTVLRPADDAGVLSAVVERLLAAVGYGADPGNTAVAVGSDGRWRHGELAGLAAPLPDGPRLLGAAARAVDRARRAARLREEIADLERAREVLAGQLAVVDQLLAELGTADDQLPVDTGVVSAVLAARVAAEKLGSLEVDAERAADAETAARRTADTAAAEAAAHCDAHQLPRMADAVARLLDALTSYLELLTGLEARLGLVEPLREAARGAEENRRRVIATAQDAEKDAQADRKAAYDQRIKADAAREALTHGAQDILTEATRLKRQVDALDKLLKRLGDEHGQQNLALVKAQSVLEQTADRRQAAETAREVAVSRWWSCVDTGLPALREITDPIARHVTAALDSARAARSAISIRDWPELDRQAVRVQARWTAMTSASAELRANLEPLGGRSVRFLFPGDGQEEFPGGVELTVDSSSAGLAPPAAAERLSELLLRLQEDYDEELTKTIDELLGSTFIEHLRDRLAAAERLRTDINAKLAENPTAVSGITLRLNRTAVSDERAANEVLAALERDYMLLPEATQERIRTFLAERITSAQEQARASGDPRWRNRLAEILDYRRWFDLRLEYRTPRSTDDGHAGPGWRTLDRGDHGLLSGGAKVVTLMQPFIAALHAMYDQADSSPRMLWLDEAFGGVDGTNKASMFRLLASCDLDWLIAGPGVVANSAAVPVAAIYEVRRAPRPFPGVSLELAVWAASELTHVLTPDPADLRDIAAAGASQDGTLFADL